MIDTNTLSRCIHHSTIVRLTCVIVGWLIQCVVFSQGIAPLQLTTQLQPPYSSNINDYITAGSEKLHLIVLQRDLTQSNYRFYLRMELSVNGNVLFRTPAGWVPNEFINILPGTPTILDGTQLQTYFDANNLEFVGYSREQYMRTGNLPEGFTTICFTAYDAGRPEVSVSHPACGMYYLTLSDPPMLAMPTCGSDVLARTPQQMIFSWIAMGMGKISATPTKYEFSLYENSDGRNPNEVVESLRPIYTQQTTATMMVYSMAEPMLTEGMQYVWRVQAIDDLGKAAFKNNGYSTPCKFTYKSAAQYNWQAAPAIKLRADVLNHERVKLVYNWDKALPYDDYFLEFHKPGKENAWFSVTRTDTVYHLVNLEEDMQYEVRVTGIKGTNKGKTSTMVPFRTTKKKVANCKETPSVLATYNGRPYTSAMKNDLIKFGDFELTLNQLQKLPEPGWYRGTGTVKLDFMAGISFKVKFEQLQIDDRLVGTAGELVFMREGMEEWKEQVKSAGEVIRDLVKNVQELLKHYKGTDSDKKAIAAAQKQVNEQYEQLFNSPYLSQSTKDSLGQMQTKTKESWDALVKGKKCTETEKEDQNKGNGPYIYNEYIADEYACYTNQVAQELADIEAGTNRIASEKVEGLDCYCNRSPTVYDYILKLNPFSGESPCVFVQQALKQIKESVGDQEFSFNTSKETYASQLTSETACLSILGEGIKNTRIVYFTKEMQQTTKHTYSFKFNKQALKDYTSKEGVIKQRGLAHYNKKGISDFMILIDEDDEVKFEKQRELLKKYLGIGEANQADKKENKSTYTVSLEQMKQIFTNAKEENLKPVIEILNQYMSDFNINTPQRFVHFIAQVGHESGEFNNTLKAESCAYSEDRIKEIFCIKPRVKINGIVYKKYGDLFVDYGCDDITFCNCKNHPCGKKILISENNDLLKIKNKYIRSCMLFDYVYSLRMGNNDVNSKDGSNYRGRGILQLTGKGAYSDFNNWYNKNYPTDHIDLISNPDLILTDIKYAVLSALWEYSINKKEINSLADNDNGLQIGKLINGSGKSIPNGQLNRSEILKKAKIVFSIN